MPDGERLDGDGRQRLEQRRQREDVGDGRVARDLVVGDEAGERDAVGDAERRAPALRAPRAAGRCRRSTSRTSRRPRATRANASMRYALAGQFVQPLDVEDDVRLGDAERRAPRRARRLVLRRERRRDRRDRRPTGPARSRPSSMRALQQLPAVERDRAARAIRARERIDRPARPVVPDLGAVQRQHVRDAAARRPGRRDLDDQPVAVQMQEIGVARAASSSARR